MSISQPSPVSPSMSIVRVQTAINIETVWSISFLSVYPDLSSLSQSSSSSELGFSGPEFSWKFVFVYPCERMNKNICDLNLLLRCWEFEGVWWSELERMQSLPVKRKMARETDIYSTFHTQARWLLKTGRQFPSCCYLLPTPKNSSHTPE